APPRGAFPAPPAGPPTPPPAGLFPPAAPVLTFPRNTEPARATLRASSVPCGGPHPPPLMARSVRVRGDLMDIVQPAVTAPAAPGAAPALRDRKGNVYQPAVGPRLKVLLLFIFVAFAVLGATGAYLAAVS